VLEEQDQQVLQQMELKVVLQLFLQLVLQVVAEEDQMHQELVVLEDLVVAEQTETVEEQEIHLQLVHHKEIKADHQHQDHLLAEVVEVQVLQDLLNLVTQALQVVQEYQLLLIQQLVN
jgi:hypothetical protein